MEVETLFGLRKRHTYDEINAWLDLSLPRVPCPSRVATDIRNSHVYGQLKDSLRTYAEGQDALHAYRRGDDLAPFVPPRPRPPHQATMTTILFFVYTICSSLVPLRPYGGQVIKHPFRSTPKHTLIASHAMGVYASAHEGSMYSPNLSVRS